MLYRGKEILVNRGTLGAGQKHFFEGSDALFDRLGRGLCDLRFFCKKELFESQAFVKRAKRLLDRLPKSRPWIALDIACGHGLTGLLLAAYVHADRLREVWLLEPKTPPRSGELYSLFTSLTQTVESRVHRIPAFLGPWCDALSLDPGASSKSFVWLGCHACGDLSDAILSMAILRREPFLVMPCCPNRCWQKTWPKAAQKPPKAELSALPDLALAIDLMRLGRAQTAGYRVSMGFIDPEISPHNRVLVGLPTELEAKNGASRPTDASEEAGGDLRDPSTSQETGGDL